MGKGEGRRRGGSLVDVALEGGGDHKVTVRQGGFDDSISEVQHVHRLVHHVPHLEGDERRSYNIADLFLFFGGGVGVKSEKTQSHSQLPSATVKRAV